MQTYKKKIDYIGISFLLLLMMPYIYLSFFSHPIADDYCYASLRIGNDLLDAYKNEYLTWNGRYSSNLLMLINPIVYGWFRVYQIIPILLLVATYYSFYFFTNAILNRSANKTKLNVVSLFASLLFLFQMPTIAEGFYWYTGAVSYQLANVLVLLQLTLLIQYFNKRYFINRIVHIVVASVLLVLVVGFNETIMLIMLFFYVFLYLIRVKRFKEGNSFVGLLLIVALLASLVMIFSPGNAGRLSHFPDNHNLLRSLSFTFLQTSRFFFSWISNLPFIVLSILFIPISLILIRKLKLFRNHFHIHPFLFSSFLFVLLFLSIFPSYWSTNILGQHRTMNTAYFFFIVLWFLNISCWVSYYSSSKLYSIITLMAKATRVLLVFVVLSFALTLNGYDAFLDIFYGRALGFDQEMNERYELIRQAKEEGKEEILFQPLNNKPPTLFVLDITAQSEHWINTCFSEYFGVNRVKFGNQPLN